MANAETWIVFKVENMDTHGWEERALMPSGDLTDILHEEWWSDENVPEVGDRVLETKQDDNGSTYSRQGDWVVSRIQQFSSFDTENRIVICYCAYEPMTAKWEEVERGQPVSEMMATTP